MKKGTISDCSNSGDITNESTSVSGYTTLEYGTVMASGIVGYMQGSSSKTVSTNTNKGAIISEVPGSNNGGNSAGIVAYVVKGDIYDNINKGTIESQYQSGGIVAYSNNGTINGNTNSGNVIASTKTAKCNVAAGGIVGKVSDSGTVSNNTQEGTRVTASCSTGYSTESYAGGIIGCVFYGGTVKNNKLAVKCTISSTGDYAFAAGAVGRICGDVTYSKTTFVSNWSTYSATCVSTNAKLKAFESSDVNYKD